MLSPRQLSGLDLSFDDDHAVAFAGLLQPALLAQRLGLQALFDRSIHLGSTVGHAHSGHKAMTLIHSLLAGGECIDDANVLRAGGTAAVLGHEVRAPSTLGTFLRSFTWGHVRQLDYVAGELLNRAWQAGARNAEEPVTLDIDSTLCETFGKQKQGAKVSYKGSHSYHPLLATIAGSGEVVHCRLRGGNAHSSRGAQSFLAESFQRLRRGGVTGPLVLRADSGFYTYAVVEACRKANARFSITVVLQSNVREVIETIPEEAWAPVPSWREGGAEVAEVEYFAFRHKQKQSVRLIAVRSQSHSGQQLALIKSYTYHAFVTDREGDVLSLEQDHRRHAEVENNIRDLKYGLGLNHLPSGRFAANAAWLVLNAIAHNLAVWVGSIGLPGQPRLMMRTLRYRFLCLPGRLTRSARKWTLHLPRHWPWADTFLAAMQRIQSIPPPRPA